MFSSLQMAITLKSGEQIPFLTDDVDDATNARIISLAIMAGVSHRRNVIIINRMLSIVRGIVVLMIFGIYHHLMDPVSEYIYAKQR